MKPLTLDDLLPLEEYAARRRELFRTYHKYLDRYRRIRIGPRLTLIFENRQTLWFRLHEVLRISRLSNPQLVQQELNLYNRLLPGRGCLQAALLISIEDETRLEQELAPWKGLLGKEIRLCISATEMPANLLTCRPEDRCIGTAHWVQLVLDDRGRRLLADLDQPACFRVDRPDYKHESAALGEEVRQSLLEDLQLSDRDAA
jgi:hypothetical protein